MLIHTELRSVELNLRALLLQIQSIASSDQRIKLAYEKILEAQDLVHLFLRGESRNEDLRDRASELSKRSPKFDVKWEEK